VQGRRIGACRSWCSARRAAKQHEERGPGKTLVQYLVDAAIQAGDSKAEDAEYDKAELAERGIGGQFLQVVLHQSQQSAVDNADAANAIMSGAMRCDCSGKMEKEIRSMEYSAVLPASTMTAAVGASEMASTSHPCSGKTAPSQQRRSESRATRSTEQLNWARLRVARPERPVRQVEGSRLCVDPQQSNQQQRGGDEGV